MLPLLVLGWAMMARCGTLAIWIAADGQVVRSARRVQQ
jgi:hypothetical protein